MSVTISSVVKTVGVRTAFPLHPFAFHFILSPFPSSFRLSLHSFVFPSLPPFLPPFAFSSVSGQHDRSTHCLHLHPFLFPFILSHFPSPFPLSLHPFAFPSLLSFFPLLSPFPFSSGQGVVGVRTALILFSFILSNVLLTLQCIH